MSKTAAPRTAPAKSRPAFKVSGQGSSSGKSRRPATSTGSNSLKAKEEEYRRLNAELEAKTAELVKEAEHLVKGNLSLLCDLESSADMAPATASSQRLSTSPPVEVSSSLHSPPPLALSHPHTHTITTSPTPQPSQAHSSQSHPHKSQPLLKNGKIARKLKSKKATTKQLPSAQVVMETDSISADVDRVVLRAERDLDSVERNQDTRESVGVCGYHGNDFLPDAADDMGPEALARFLRAKLRVMQEEIDRLCRELTAKEKQLSSSEVKLKELAEHSNKLQRTHHTVQTQLEKYKGLAESLGQKCGGLESQLTALRKEVEDMKGRQKKASSQQSVVEVRLNRALEEVEKYKVELTAAQARSEDTSKSERARVDRLTSENKQLQKQRNELMTAFKKQMKLIDILKRQKMHIEAAKMLSFTEEEFVKALDWQATF